MSPASWSCDVLGCISGLSHWHFWYSFKFWKEIKRNNESCVVLRIVFMAFQLGNSDPMFLIPNSSCTGGSRLELCSNLSCYSDWGLGFSAERPHSRLPSSSETQPHLFLSCCLHVSLPRSQNLPLCMAIHLSCGRKKERNKKWWGRGIPIRK